MSYLDIEAIVKLHVPKLRQELNIRGLDHKGTKQVLLTRLLTAVLVNNDVGVKDDDVGKKDGGEDCNAPPTQSTINLDESTLGNDKDSIMNQSFSEAQTDNEMTQNPKDSTVQELNAELNELSQQSVFEAKISEFEDEVKIKLTSLRTDLGLPPNSNPWQTMTAVEAERLTAENANLKQKLCLAEQQNQAQSQEILIFKEEKASLLTSLRLCCGDNASKVETKTDKVKAKSKTSKKNGTKNSPKSMNEQSSETEQSYSPQTNTASEKNYSNTIVLLGDSMVKNVQGWNVGKEIKQRFVVKSFSGAKVDDMYHYVKPTMQNAPAEIAIHCGTNDLRIKEPKAIAESLINLAKVVQTESTKVSISELIIRADTDLNANTPVKNACKNANMLQLL